MATTEPPAAISTHAASNDTPTTTFEVAAGNTVETNIDSNLITWSGPHDPANAQNWSFTKRWEITAISSAFTFVSRLSTSMIAPALTSIAQDLRIQQPFERQLTLSSFVLAGAIGPLLAGPLSEMYGRQYVLQVLNLFYVAFNTACGFAHNGPTLLVCRFFAGLGGSAATVIGAGVLADVWKREERGLSVSIYTSITLISPTLGPVLGGFITQYSSWRWTFWSVSIANICIQIIGIFLLRETYAPVILSRKAAAMRKETGNPDLHSKWEIRGLTFRQNLLAALSRPLKMLLTQPICMVLALYSIYIFGLVYLALATFAEVWTSRYHESVGISGLNYIAQAIGYIIGIQTCAKMGDEIYRRLVSHYGGTTKPEYRLPLMVPGAILLPAGLLWYGWSAQSRLAWIMPDIGIAIFAIGVKYSTLSIQLYSLDVYPTIRFPGIVPYMYQSLGYGWGNSVLALIGIVLGAAIPPLLWKFGPHLRKISPYASG